MAAQLLQKHQEQQQRMLSDRKLNRPSAANTISIRKSKGKMEESMSSQQMLNKMGDHMAEEFSKPPQPEYTVSYATSYATAALNWIQKKNYQYEVTFSLYMLTPIEKFIFNFLLITLTTAFITAIFYFPRDISFIYGRAYYYIEGSKVPAAISAITRSPDVTAVQTAGSLLLEPTCSIIAEL